MFFIRLQALLKAGRHKNKIFLIKKQLVNFQKIEYNCLEHAFYLKLYFFTLKIRRPLMQGRIVTKDSFQIVGFGWTGPYTMSREIPKLWEKFLKRIDEIPHQLRPGVFISPCHDRVTDLTCYIGVEVKSADHVPEGMLALTVPTQRYAVFTHKGPIKSAPATYQRAWKWIEKMGYQKDHSTLGLEVYDHRYVPSIHDPSSSACTYEIYVPIKK
jgi:AraC family transcriptional regulator